MLLQARLLWVALALTLGAGSSPVDLNVRVQDPITIGYRSVDTAHAQRYEEKGTLVWSPSDDGLRPAQIGKGIYLTEKLGQWVGEYVCKISAERAAFNSAAKVWVPKLMDGCKALWYNFDNVEVYLKRFSPNFKIANVILFSLISGKESEGPQMLIPQEMLKDNGGPLDASAECCKVDDQQCRARIDEGRIDWSTRAFDVINWGATDHHVQDT